MPSRGSSQRKQELLLLRISQRYERVIAQEISRATRQAEDKPLSTIQSPQWYVEHVGRLNKIMTRLWAASGEAFAEQLGDTLKSDPRYEKKELPTPDVINGIIANWIRQYGGGKITEMAETTQKTIAQVVADGVEDGLSEKEISKLITDVAREVSPSRGQTIARTEAHGVGMATSVEVAKVSDVPMVKVWLSSGGERTREAHAAVNGQEVGLDEAFKVDGESLEYPGDPNGSAKNVINCRCGVGYELV